MVRLWALGVKPGDLSHRQRFDKCERRKRGSRKTRKSKRNRKTTGLNGWPKYVTVIEETEDGETRRRMTWEEFFEEGEFPKRVKPQEEPNIMSLVFDAALPRQKGTPTFWWNENTARLAVESLRAFRQFAKLRRRERKGQTVDLAQCDELFQKFKEARRIKTKAMKKAKVDAWMGLLSKLDENDPCIRSFKLLLSTLTPPLVCKRDVDFLEQVADKLSPEVVFPESVIDTEEKLAVTLNQKSDTMLKRLWSLMLGAFGDSTKIFQLCMKRHSFPQIWKLALLLVLKKDGIPSVLPLAYQPIPLSSEFESDIVFQIIYHLNGVEDFVVKREGEACCVLWRCVHQGLRERGVPLQLIHLLEEYLRSHFLVKDVCVVHGNSILCPLLVFMCNAMIMPYVGGFAS